MSAQHVLVARMGQMQVTSDGAMLKAIMGSCVGIGILWRKREVYAMSHCLLGNAPPDSGEPTAKFVSHAVPMMLQAMGAVSARDLLQLEAVVVGGGQMLQQSGNPGGEEIGPSNLAAAKENLRAHNVTLRHLENAEYNASQLFVDGRTGEYKVVLIPKLVIDADAAKEVRAVRRRAAGGAQ